MAIDPGYEPSDVEWVEIRPGYRKTEAPICGIYAITHKASNRSYIGSSIDVRRRLAAHISALCRGAHVNSHLQLAWVKYGAEAFACYLVQFSEPTNLHIDEQVFLDTEGDAFNVCFVAGSPPSRKGQRNTLEHRRKTAAANIGKKQNRTAEWNAAIAAGQRGKTRSVSARAHVSAALTGRTLSVEHRAAISRGNTGRTLSATHRANLSAARRRTVAAKRGVL